MTAFSKAEQLVPGKCKRTAELSSVSAVTFRTRPRYCSLAGTLPWTNTSLWPLPSVSTPPEDPDTGGVYRAALRLASRDHIAYQYPQIVISRLVANREWSFRIGLQMWIHSTSNVPDRRNNNEAGTNAWPNKRSEVGAGDPYSGVGTEPISWGCGKGEKGPPATMKVLQPQYT